MVETIDASVIRRLVEQGAVEQIVKIINDKDDAISELMWDIDSLNFDIDRLKSDIFYADINSLD